MGAGIRGQIAQSHVSEEAEPIADLLDDLDRNFTAPTGQFEGREKLDGAFHGQGRDLRHASAGDEHIARCPVEPGSPAFGAGTSGAVFRQFFPHRRRLGFLVAALEVLYDAFESVLALERSALSVQVIEFDLFLVASEQYKILYLFRQALERRLDVELG